MKQFEEDVWISVGHPALPVPYIHRTPMTIKRGHYAEAGNKLRKLCAKNPTLIGLPKEITIPAEDFYFVVFNTDGKSPMDAVCVASDNYYWKYGVREQMGDIRKDFESYCPDFQGMLHPVKKVEISQLIADEAELEKFAKEAYDELDASESAETAAE